MGKNVRQGRDTDKRLFLNRAAATTMKHLLNLIFNIAVAISAQVFYSHFQTSQSSLPSISHNMRMLWVRYTTEALRVASDLSFYHVCNLTRC